MRCTQPLSDIRRDDRLEPGRRPRWRRAVSAPVWSYAWLLAVCVAVTGCGGGPSTPHVASGATTTATTSPSDHSTTHANGLLTYASCMRSHGVPNFPDPSGDGGIPKQAVISSMQQVSNSQANAAQNACRSALPAGGSLSGQAYHPVTTHDQRDYLKAAACMRSHGVPNFPDPNFSGGNVSFPIPSSTDTHSTQFNEARQTCQKLIPAGLPESGSEG
jgi:hypothetical protein